MNAPAINLSSKKTESQYHRILLIYIRIIVLIIHYFQRRLFYVTICAFFRHIERIHVCFVCPLSTHYKILTSKRCISYRTQKTTGYWLSYLFTCIWLISAKLTVNVFTLFSLKTIN